MDATINLTDEQKLAIDNANQALKDKNPIYRIGGYAGTGKTTVARFIVESNRKCMPCAFTGKAALRLREKGLSDSRTIHSTIYEYDWEAEEFYLMSEVEGDWFLIDEGSMISKLLWNDIQTFEKPILVLGDPGQLEPVGDDPNLMKDPDITLKEIHRQAEGNSIIKFATDIRLGTFAFSSLFNQVPLYNPEQVMLCGRNRGYLMEDLLWADVCICGFNRTRNSINKRIRNVKGFKETLLPGERIIILRNDKKQGVFNGQLLIIKEIIKEQEKLIEVRCGDEEENYTLLLLKSQFNKEKTLSFEEVKNEIMDLRLDFNTRKRIVLADYGYAITCHKSQGSEWNKVLVIDEQCPTFWDSTRWRYTAITRASQELRFFFR